MSAEEFQPEYPPDRDLEAQLQLFAACIKPFQEPNYPYHNWEWHISTSFAEGMRLCDEYDQARIRNPELPPIDRMVVGIALLGHDSGYSHFRSDEEVLEQTGFENKEEYSCHITELVAQSLGLEPETVDAAKACIRATRRGSKCETTESWIVRHADLFNIAADYDFFKEATTRFRDEIAMLSEKNTVLTLGEFMCSSWPILRDYISEDRSLWPGDKHPLGPTKFYINACLNIYRLLAESGISVTTGVFDFIRDLPANVRREN